MLGKLLIRDTVQIQVTASHWQEAIQLACQPLIDNGSIEPCYVAKIIETTQQIGPYYVIAPGFAMPHARPEDGVNKMALSLTTLNKAVAFGNEENDPVKLVITLAATDSHTHIDAIVGITQLLENQEDFASILATDNVEDALGILKKY